jgi:hypothetical protein
MAASKPDLLQTVGERFARRRQAESARERLAREREAFDESDIGTRESQRGIQAFVRREAKERELTESILSKAGEDFAPDDVEIVEQNPGLGAMISEDARKRELREDILSKIDDEFSTDDVVIEESGDGLQAGVSLKARRRELKEDVLNRVDPAFEADDVVISESGNGLTAKISEQAQRQQLTEDVLSQVDDPDFRPGDVAIREIDQGLQAELSEQAQRRELREDVVQQAGGDIPADDVVIEESGDGLEARVSEAAVSREVGQSRQQAIEQAAAERERFSADDLTVVDEGGEQVVRPTEAAQRRDVREQALQQVGGDFDGSDIEVEETGDVLQASVSEGAQRRELREQVAQQAGDEFVPGDVVIEQGEGGLRGEISRSAVERERQKTRQEALTSAAKDLKQFDADDLTIVEREQTVDNPFGGAEASAGASEVVIQPTDEALREQVAQRAADRAGAGVAPEDIAIDQSDGEFEAELSSAAVRQRRQAVIEDVRQDLAQQAGEEFAPEDVAVSSSEGEVTARLSGEAVEQAQTETRTREVPEFGTVAETQPVFETVERRQAVRDGQGNVTGFETVSEREQVGTETVEREVQTGTKTVTETVPDPTDIGTERLSRDVPTPGELLERDIAAERVEKQIDTRAREQLTAQLEQQGPATGQVTTQQTRQVQAGAIRSAKRALDVDLSADDVSVSGESVALTAAGQETVSAQAGGTLQATAAQTAVEEQALQERALERRARTLAKNTVRDAADTASLRAQDQTLFAAQERQLAQQQARLRPQDQQLFETAERRFEQQLRAGEVGGATREAVAGLRERTAAAQSQRLGFQVPDDAIRVTVQQTGSGFEIGTELETEEARAAAREGEDIFSGAVSAVEDADTVIRRRSPLPTRATQAALAANPATAGVGLASAALGGGDEADIAGEGSVANVQALETASGESNLTDRINIEVPKARPTTRAALLANPATASLAIGSFAFEGTKADRKDRAKAFKQQISKPVGDVASFSALAASPLPKDRVVARDRLSAALVEGAEGDVAEAFADLGGASDERTRGVGQFFEAAGRSGAEAANLPQIGVTAQSGVEFGAAGVDAIRSGEGEQFAGETAGQATLLGARGAEAAVSDPTETAGLVAGGAVAGLVPGYAVGQLGKSAFVRTRNRLATRPLDLQGRVPTENVERQDVRSGESNGLTRLSDRAAPEGSLSMPAERLPAQPADTPTQEIRNIAREFDDPRIRDALDVGSDESVVFRAVSGRKSEIYEPRSRRPYDPDATFLAPSVARNFLDVDPARTGGDGIRAPRPVAAAKSLIAAARGENVPTIVATAGRVDPLPEDVTDRAAITQFLQEERNTGRFFAPREGQQTVSGESEVFVSAEGAVSTEPMNFRGTFFDPDEMAGTGVVESGETTTFVEVGKPLYTEIRGEKVPIQLFRQDTDDVTPLSEQGSLRQSLRVGLGDDRGQVDLASLVSRRRRTRGDADTDVTRPDRRPRRGRGRDDNRAPYTVGGRAKTPTTTFGTPSTSGGGSQRAGQLSVPTPSVSSRSERSDIQSPAVPTETLQSTASGTSSQGRGSGLQPTQAGDPGGYNPTSPTTPGIGSQPDPYLSENTDIPGDRSIQTGEGTEDSLTSPTERGGGSTDITTPGTGGDPITAQLSTPRLTRETERKPDERDSEFATFDVEGEFEKQFSSAVAAPEVVSGGSVEELGDPSEFSERASKTTEEGLNLRVTGVQGDIGEAERLAVGEIDDGLGDELI